MRSTSRSQADSLLRCVSLAGSGIVVGFTPSAPMTMTGQGAGVPLPDLLHHPPPSPDGSESEGSKEKPPAADAPAAGIRWRRRSKNGLMATAAERFDEYLTTRTRPSRRFNGSTLPSELRERGELLCTIASSHLRRYIQQHSLDVDPELIHVGLVAEPRLNAWAAKHAGVYLVGINAAVPALVDRIWNRILGQTEAFPRVGDPNTARDTPATPLPNPTWLSDDDRLDDEALADEIADASMLELPADGTRARFAAEMSALTTTFCIFHEAGHLLAGHADRAAMLGLRDGVQEGPEESAAGGPAGTAPGNGLDRHAWEVVADHYGFQVLLQQMAQGGALRRGSPIAERWWRGIDAPDPVQRFEVELAVGSAAMAALFLLFVAANASSSATHPHPFLRLSFLSLQRQHVLAAPPAEDGANASDVAWTALSQVWAGFKLLGLPTLATPPFDKVHGVLKDLEQRVRVSNDSLRGLGWDARRQAT